MTKLAVAVATSEALDVYGGGGPPEPCPVVGISQRANSTGVVHDEGGVGNGGVVLTVKVDVANFPVSSESTNK